MNPINSIKTNHHPIGFFDSGVGGTSVWKEVVRLLPNESTIYLADSANAPYGERSREEIISLSRKNTEFLLDQNCKMIVVPCNTATTNAIDFLRNHYDVPFVGIEPAIKPAALSSKNKSIGILATKGTLSSDLFYTTSKKYAQEINVIETVGTGLVELIEAGKADDEETRDLLKGFLAPMIKASIDYLVLGCSHYPYLKPVLQGLLPADVQIIDSGIAVARQTQNLLEKHNLFAQAEKNGKHLLYSNADPSVLKALVNDIQVDKEVGFLQF